MSLKSLSDNPHAKLLFIWSALDLILLSAGILTVIASICFHRPRQLIINLVFDDIHFVCGLALGSAYIAACIFSIPAIFLGKGRLWALKALNWGLVILIIATLLFASWIWFFSLRQLQKLCDIWESQPPLIQQAIQDQWSCCGYWNGTDSGKFETVAGLCGDVGFAAGQPGCMSIITSPNSPGTDHILNKIFTSLYGWIAILISFFLATVCVIKERKVEVRFARIDEKRGGGGFV